MSSIGVVAITSTRQPLGRAVLARLREDEQVTRVIALDATAAAPHPRVEVRPVAVSDPRLAAALSDVDVLVHDPLPEGLATRGARAHAAAVDGTRDLLAAAAASGVRRIVHLSSAVTYGAHPDNDVPLTEDSPLRAGPDFDYGYHHLLAEELVAEWAAAHPEVIVVVLRPVTTLGPDVDDPVSRHLEAPRLPLVRGMEPPVQFVALDDVAAAVQLAATSLPPGAYNVAADGWLSVADVVALLGRKPLWLPEQVALSTGRQLWLRGVIQVPPGALRHLMYPWVVSSARLQAAGWAPTRSNREVLRDFAARHGAYLAFGPVRLRRRDLAAAVAAAGISAVTATGLLVTAGLRRRRAG